MGYRIKSNLPSAGSMDEAEILDRKDRFLLFVEENRSLILGSIFLVVIAAVVGGVFMWLDHQKSQEAWVLEGEAQALYVERPVDEPETAKENLEKASAVYQEILDQYPRTTPAQSAQYFLGNVLMEQENAQGAIDAYTDFLEQYGRNEVLQGLVRQRLGYAYLVKGERDKALQEFSTVLSMPGSLNKDQVLFELAKMDESEDAMEKALARYKDLLEQFPNSPYASEATLRVQALSPEETTPDASMDENAKDGGSDKKVEEEASAKAEEKSEKD